MNRLRLVTNNATDRATISVAGTAAGMGADKLKTDIKGEVCRVLGTSCTITLNWASLEVAGVVVIPISNLGPSSTIRARAYLDSRGTTLLADTGVLWAAPGTILENWDFSQDLNVNAFTDGIGAITSCYFESQVACRKIVIDITNPDGTFIDLARLVVGGYHEVQYNADYGATIGTLDLTKNSRAASGDIKTDWGPRANTLQFDLNWVANTDRERIRQMIARGIGRFVFMSLFPENADPVLERDYSIYGKLVQPGSMVFNNYNLHSTNIQIEGF